MYDCPAMEEMQNQLTIGSKVKIVQQIAARDYSWATEVIGTVVAFEQQKTGSWYVHSKNKRLWLDRLTVKKADGEISVLNLDQYSRVEVL